ncbi:MAG TPA: Ada metal-binding domain-containing protein [Cyclobacteriaceae bacterium]|nr:Ada metal-binding domain-containing protein [Cyclobacteriaceae bacterium]HPW62342.1 Ada metal-binding domain-containing protein [Cyclobacteriaceae bacterium]
MLFHSELTRQLLRRLIKNQTITLAGNSRLKIYGLLSCASGKRMKRQNRVFFVSKKDALKNVYRPCGHCLPKEYQAWIYSTQNPL